MTKRLFKGLVGAVVGLLMGAFYGLSGTGLAMGLIGILAAAIFALFDAWPTVDPNTLGVSALWVMKIGTIIGVVLGPWLGFAYGFEKSSEDMSYHDYLKPIWPFYLFRRRSVQVEG